MADQRCLIKFSQRKAILKAPRVVVPTISKSLCDINIESSLLPEEDSET
jgi:hypothetical protein